MKRKIVISLIILSVFVACFFVACSNDRDALDIYDDAMNSSKYMTREEIQNRLDDIGEMYEETIILVPETDTTKVTEEFFTWVESLYQNNNKKKTIKFGNTIIKDEQIDEITIPEIGTYAAPGEVNSYTGTITNEYSYQYWDGSHNYEDCVQVIITWNTNTGGSMNKVTAELIEVVVKEINSYSLTGFSHSPIVGDISNPGFSYEYTIVAPNGIHYNYTGMK